MSISGIWFLKPAYNNMLKPTNVILNSTLMKKQRPERTEREERLREDRFQSHSSSGAAVCGNLRYFSMYLRRAHRLCCCIMGASAASISHKPPLSPAYRHVLSLFAAGFSNCRVEPFRHPDRFLLNTWAEQNFNKHTILRSFA